MNELVDELREPGDGRDYDCYAEFAADLFRKAADEIERLEGAVANIDETSDDVDSRSWRGVVAIEHPKKILFRKRIDIGPGKLRAWTPDPIDVRSRRDGTKEAGA